MKTTTCYVTVRLNIEYDETQYLNEKDAIQDVVQECDYGFGLDADELKIVDTEICEVSDKYIWH